MKQNLLSPSDTALMVIDVQEKLFPHVERSCDTFFALAKMVKGARILDLPIVVTEQYPQGLGETIFALKERLDPAQIYHPKTTFSSLGDAALEKMVMQMKADHWILVGIEAHVCVLQTAKALLRVGKSVTVLNDAISSRSIFDYSSAIAEMRDCGARISTVETVIFELTKDSKSPKFKEISRLIQCGCENNTSPCCQQG